MNDTVANLEQGQAVEPSQEVQKPETEIDYKQEYEKNKAALAQLEQEKELLKKDRDGQNKKNSEYLERLKALEEKELSEKELFEKRQQEWQDEKEQQSKELAAKQRQIDLSNAVNSLGLDPELADFIPGTNYEEFLEKGKILKEKLTALVEAGTKTQLGAVDKDNPLETGATLGRSEKFKAILKDPKGVDVNQALMLMKQGKAG